MPLYVGTSGWQYAHWRRRFYPPDLRQASWLEHYAERFQTVEINNTFYRLPPASTFEAWRVRSPDDFVFVPKVSRYLTHIRRLKDPREPAALFMERAIHLGPKLGPLLIQLPPNLGAEPERLEQTLRAFPSDVRLAFEFRHDSWFTDEVRSLLESRNAALCLADRKSKLASPLWRTSDWAYVRFHQGTAFPRPCYGRGALWTWVQRIAELWSSNEDVFVYFNNDPEGCAIRDAIVFAQLATRVGLEPTRVPSSREVSVG